MGKEVKQWITVNGVHVPIFEGESKEDAVKNYLSKRKAEAGKKKSGNTYDEMGKKVEENRKKMGNASPEEKRKLINENHDLMTKMDQTMQDAKLKPVKEASRMHENKLDRSAAIPPKYTFESGGQYIIKDGNTKRPATYLGVSKSLGKLEGIPGSEYATHLFRDPKNPSKQYYIHEDELENNPELVRPKQKRGNNLSKMSKDELRSMRDDPSSTPTQKHDAGMELRKRQRERYAELHPEDKKDDLGNAEDRTDRMKIYRDQLQEVQEDIKQFESTKPSLRSPDYDEKLAALKKKEADLKGWFDRDAKKFREKKKGYTVTANGKEVKTFNTPKEADDYIGGQLKNGNGVSSDWGVKHDGRSNNWSDGQVTHYSDINQVPKKLKPGEQYALYLKKGKMPNDGGKFAGQSYNAEYQGKGTYGVSNPKNMSPMAGFKTYEAMKKAYEERSNTPGQSYEIAIIKEPSNTSEKKPSTIFGQETNEKINAYREKFLKNKTPEQIQEIKDNLEKGGNITGFTPEDNIALAAIRREQEDRKKQNTGTGFKTRAEAEEFYKNKFAGVSATYANKMAKKLGIEGRGKDKREALAKHYADQWETSSNMSKGEDEKEKQIARNQQEANNAQSQNVNKPNQPEEKKLPKYSNEQGYILSSTVQADSRYENIKNAFEEFKSERKNYKTGGYEMRGNGFLADDFLRGLMKKEEKGETSGEMTVNVWNGESLRDKMKAYRAAFKAAGYRVVSSDNDDIINHGYMGARGRRVYSSRERARTLHYEKISK